MLEWMDGWIVSAGPPCMDWIVTVVVGVSCEQQCALLLVLYKPINILSRGPLFGFPIAHTIFEKRISYAWNTKRNLFVKLFHGWV